MNAETGARNLQKASLAGQKVGFYDGWFVRCWLVC